jgi:predicted ABC-type transport system involved in lysophospholipase L1 biosynthesis ATPase subunit
MALMTTLFGDIQSTLILVTHSHRIAAQADRALTLRDGRLVDFDATR